MAQLAICRCTTARLYRKAHNSLTLPDYLTHRFEDKSNALRIIASAVILIFFTIYCASGVVAGARLFENTFHMEYETALIIGAAATILYVFIGGFLAVSWTDTIQAAIMCVALVVTPLPSCTTRAAFLRRQHVWQKSTRACST